MDIPIIQVFIAIVTTFISINLLRPLAININLVDNPTLRKRHTGSVPLIGGITMFIGIVISILVSPNDLNEYKFFFLTSFIIILIGVLDDNFNISVSLRLLFQLLVGLILVSVGDVNIGSFGNISGAGELTLNNWSYFITVIAIILAMNAVNMADGIHGLAGGNSLITFLAILFITSGEPFQGSLLVVILFCAVLPIFLIYNLCLGLPNDKRIFMGDAGSMFIGLSIAWILIDMTQGEAKLLSPVTALWLFALPIIEISSAILRRITSGKSPFKADLFHSHHILIAFGFSQNKALVTILFISFLMALVGILGEIYGFAEKVMFLGFLGAFICHIITYSMIIKKLQINKT